MLKSNILSISSFSLLVLMAAGCGQNQDQLYTVNNLETPASSGSGQSNLATNSSGDVYLSWIETGRQHEHALRYAVLNAGSDTWSDPKTFVEDDGWFVNWADFPSMMPLENGMLTAHWLDKVPGDWYAYHVKMAFMSSNPDSLISGPIRPHLDDSPTEHGFVSMVPMQDDRVLAIWLDGRNMVGGHQHGEMTLRSAEVTSSGEILNKKEIDGRVCECCQTSATRIGESFVVAYRDRSEDEIRDISLSRYHNGAWSEPKVVHEDNWHFMGCPVNGPALASSGDHGGVAWFTGVGDNAKVYFTHLDESLEHINNPIRVDDGFPLGRVDVVMQPDGTAWVSWVEKTDDGAETRLRRIDQDGKAGHSLSLHSLSPERRSGFPRMALSGDRLVVAWTDLSDESTVKTALVELGEP